MFIKILIFLSGFAALSWEVLWQIKSSLALGISALGAAITLAVTLGGMGVGGFFMGNALRKRSSVSAVRLYGFLEIIIGSAGLIFNSALQILEKLDTWIYSTLPTSAALIYLFGLIVILGIPTLCMGATLPVFSLISQQFKISLAELYSLNTLGAACGVLSVAFMLIPLFGITHTIWIIAGINMLVGLVLCLFVPNKHLYIPNKAVLPQFQPILSRQLFIVFVTGFATFTLEIAWFRALSSVFPNTTDAFAMMLACVIIALGLAAKSVSTLKQNQKALGTRLCLAGMLILLMTPLIERLDWIYMIAKKVMANQPMSAQLNAVGLLQPNISENDIFHYVFHVTISFFLLYLIIGPSMRLLGAAFPSIFENERCTATFGKLYAINTFAAIIGSIGAAWILLPLLGFAKTAWIAGVLVVVAGIYITPGKKRFVWAALAMMTLFIAMFYETGLGKTHAQGFFATDEKGRPGKVLGFFEGKDSTTSAVAYPDGTHALLINSTLASWESGPKTDRQSIHYMAWMGHLPMMLQQNPKKALVICFGTGQTANAVRNENPAELDIVDINPSVFKLANNFISNENVLKDFRVKKIVMDGRAYLRRTQKTYDVITLEPMPPNTVGVNALYSKEFYELARQKLSDNGVIAQWLPFHIVTPHFTASIAKTFVTVFPNSILWIDPDSKTGILLGAKNPNTNFAAKWPGSMRAGVKRNLPYEQVQHDIALNSEELTRYASFGEIISDDNQLLAYGKAIYVPGILEENFALLHRINSKIAIEPLGANFL